MQSVHTPKSQAFRYWPTVGKEEDSPYYWLYKFLERIPDYGPDHPCWELFGDVDEYEFWEWLEGPAVSSLLTIEPIAVNFINDEDVLTARDSGKLIVAIDPHADLSSLMRDFFQVLAESGASFQKNSVGRPEEIDEIIRSIQLGTKFHLEGVPQTERMKRAIQAKDLAASGADPEDIAKEIGLGKYTRGHFIGKEKTRRDAIEDVRLAIADYDSIIKGLSLQTPRFPAYHKRTKRA